MAKSNWCSKSLGLVLYCLVATSAVRVQQPGKIVRGKSKENESHTAQSMLLTTVNSTWFLERIWDECCCRRRKLEDEVTREYREKKVALNIRRMMKTHVEIEQQ